MNAPPPSPPPEQRQKSLRLQQQLWYQYYQEHVRPVYPAVCLVLVPQQQSGDAPAAPWWTESEATLRRLYATEQVFVQMLLRHPDLLHGLAVGGSRVRVHNDTPTVNVVGGGSTTPTTTTTNHHPTTTAYGNDTHNNNVVVVSEETMQQTTIEAGLLNRATLAGLQVSRVLACHHKHEENSAHNNHPMRTMANPRSCQRRLARLVCRELALAMQLLVHWGTDTAVDFYQDLLVEWGAIVALCQRLGVEGVDADTIPDDMEEEEEEGGQHHHGLWDTVMDEQGDYETYSSSCGGEEGRYPRVAVE